MQSSRAPYAISLIVAVMVQRQEEITHPLAQMVPQDSVILTLACGNIVQQT